MLLSFKSGTKIACSLQYVRRWACLFSVFYLLHIYAKASCDLALNGFIMEKIL